jgi:hypothetical protein
MSLPHFGHSIPDIIAAGSRLCLGLNQDIGHFIS